MRATTTGGMSPDNAGELDPVFQRFVEKCLSDKGYEVIGWR